MEQIPLGRTGRTIGALLLGSVTFGREIDEEQAHRVMDYAVEKGIDSIDTAEQYGGGQARQSRKERLGFEDCREVSTEMSSAERIIGRWLRSRGCRKEITLCSKVSTGGSAKNIVLELERSLDRLATDYLDVYYMHVPNRDVPIDETLDALTSEVRAGRIGVIGCSNYSAAQLQEALDASTAGGYNRFEILQPPYNLVQPEAEAELFPLCRREQISVATYSPLGAGLLTGRFDPDRPIPAGTRFYVAPDYIDIYFTERNFRIVARLREKAAELGIPMVRLASAWTMSHPDVTSVVIGADTTQHVDEALAAYAMALDPDLRSEMSAWAKEL